MVVRDEWQVSEDQGKEIKDGYGQKEEELFVWSAELVEESCPAAGLGQKGQKRLQPSPLKVTIPQTEGPVIAKFR